MKDPLITLLSLLILLSTKPNLYAQGGPYKFSIVSLVDRSSPSGEDFKKSIDAYFNDSRYLRKKYLSDYFVFDNSQTGAFKAAIKMQPKAISKIFRSKYFFIFDISHDINLKSNALMKITASVTTGEDANKVHIADFLLYKDEIDSVLESLSEMVIDRIVSKDIDPNKFSVLYVVTNDSLYQKYKSYQNICKEILKDPVLKKICFVVLDENSGTICLDAELRAGKNLFMKLTDHRRFMADGTFQNISELEIESKKIHIFCQVLNDRLNGQKNTNPHYRYRLN